VRRDRTALPFARYARCPARELFTFSTRPGVWWIVNNWPIYKEKK
jgi:hypothetical protein